MSTGADSISSTSMTTCFNKLVAMAWIPQVNSLTVYDWSSQIVPVKDLELS
jgi:hypothetical protein